MKRNRRKVNNDVSKSEVKYAASAELQKPKEKLENGRTNVEIGQPNRMSSSFSNSRISQKQVVTSSIKTRSMKKLEDLLIANKSTSLNEDHTSNVISKKLSSNKVDAVHVSKRTLTTEKANSSKVARSKSVDRTTVDHREKEKTTSKIIRRKRSASVCKGTRKIRSKSVDVSKMEHTSSNMKREEKQTTGGRVITKKRSASTNAFIEMVEVREIKKRPGTAKKTGAKRSRSALSKSLEPATKKHSTTSTFNETNDNKITTRKDKNTIVDARKSTRNLRSKSVEVSKRTLGSGKSSTMENTFRGEQQTTRKRSASTNTFKEMQNIVEVGKSTRERKSKPVVSRKATGTAKDAKSTRSKFVEPTTMEHTATSTSNVTKENNTTTSKIVSRKGLATVNSNKEKNAVVIEVRKSERKSRSRSVDVSNRTLGSGKPSTMEHTLSSNIKGEKQQTTGIITRKRSASTNAFIEICNMVEVRKSTRNVKSKSVETKKESGTAKETGARRPKPKLSRSVEPTTMNHTSTFNTKKEQQETSGIITRKRSTSTNHSQEESEKVSDAKHPRVSRAKSIESTTISTPIEHMSLNSTEVNSRKVSSSQIISKGGSKSASIHKEMTSLDKKKTDIKHESNSVAVLRPMARTTVNTTKETEEKAISSNGSTMKILPDENAAIHSYPPTSSRSLKHLSTATEQSTTSKTMENKVKKATDNGTISEITLQSKTIGTEGTNGSSKQRNENVQQQCAQKLTHSEKSSDTESSHSIIGSPMYQSTPVESKNTNPPTNDILGVTQSNLMKDGPNLRGSLPAVRLSMWSVE